MDVGLLVLGVAARADRPDGRALADQGLASDRYRAEVDEGHRVSVGRLDRHGAASSRHGAGEAHDPRGRRAHGRPGGRRDVGAAVLSTGVGIVAEDERS